MMPPSPFGTEHFNPQIQPSTASWRSTVIRPTLDKRGTEAFFGIATILFPEPGELLFLQVVNDPAGQASVYALLFDQSDLVGIANGSIALLTIGADDGTGAIPAGGIAHMRHMQQETGTAAVADNRLLKKTAGFPFDGGIVIAPSTTPRVLTLPQAATLAVTARVQK